MTIYRTRLVAEVIFNNGIEKQFVSKDQAMNKEDFDDLSDAVEQMRDIIRTAYREDGKGSITVGDAMIAVHMTSSINLTLVHIVIK